MKSFATKYISLLFLVAALPFAMQAKDTNNNVQCFKHNIQLQLCDGYGLPVDGTEFWVTLDIIKRGNLVTIQFPVINFQTGPIAEADIFGPLPGGYLYTADGFLPENIRPADLVNRSIIAASNNGASLPFSFAQPISALPVPPDGYILQVTNAGAIVVQCAGTFGNIIPDGPQILMPCEITYILKPRQQLCTNYVIDSGFTNVTEFPSSSPTGISALDTGLRDLHVNDAFDGVAAWAWTSNGNIPDKTNGTLNVFVAIGSINGDGTLSIGNPIQLTDLPAGVFAWETAVAINRTNPKNIVVSWSVFNAPGTPSRAVSFDGGKTWPINGPTNIQPTGIPSGAGDNRGVAADKFGNIWYSTTNFVDNFGNYLDQPTFWISTDGGDTYSVAYTAPFVLNTYDYPQYCFGGDGLGNYGLWFFVDYFSATGTGIWPMVGFLPITGLGSYGTCTPVQLTGLINTSVFNIPTASADGRLWTQGAPSVQSSLTLPLGLLFKSPGSLTENYAGPWNLNILNYISAFVKPNNQVSSMYDDGADGGFVQSIIYDENRQALYALLSAQNPDYSQNMNIYFFISRDNGQTWSDPLYITTTNFANRGFQSMALDTVTGNVVFGWYDGRNDSTYQSLQYFGAILPAAQLDAMVNRIPLSNPLYALPAATGIVG